jgi:hypothetical protein
MFLRRFFVLSLLTFSAAASADMFDINLRDTSAQLQYKALLGGGREKSEFHMGVLYTNTNNLLGDMGIMVKNEVGGDAPGLSVGVGIKALAVRVKPATASALALGGLVRYSPYASRIGVVGLVYLSPNITTFGDADRYLETGVSLEYEVMPEAVTYLGYRRIAFTTKSGTDALLDEGVHVGLRLRF